MQQTLRIAIVTRSLMMGGAQNHIVKLCKELENTSISVYLLINDEPEDLIRELPSRIKLHIFPYRRHDIRTIFWLANEIRNEKIQVVHSFLWHADFYSSLLKILIPRIVVIASERGDRGAKSFYKWMYRWVDKLLVFNLVDGFCANSQFGASLLNSAGYNTEKIRVISNGINLAYVDSYQAIPLKEIYKWPQSSVICCVVSRLVTYKGIDTFIRVLKMCETDIRVVIVGEGPEREYLSQLIRQLALEDRVVLAGQFSPVIPHIKGADICILPTTEDTEHCSNSILEYMACSKPVIATNVGGNSELIIPGVTGFLINPEHMEVMASKIDTLSVNELSARQMGLAGRKRIEEGFQMKIISDNFLSIWHEFYRQRYRA